jgi:hypothetical protein
VIENPFSYGSPVHGDYFTGRRDEIRELVRLATSHINAVLVAPRRIGKTSLLDAAVGKLREDGANLVTINAMQTADNLGTFASRLLTGVYSARGPWHRAGDALSTFLSSLRSVRPAVQVGEKGPEFTITAADVESDPVGVLGKAYALLGETDTPVLVIDEFQELTLLPGRIPALFKSLTDMHPNVSLIIAGSREHMMRQLVTSPTGPLYGAMQALHLQPLAPEVMGDFVERRFNVGGKPTTREVADLLVATAGPIPNDIQRLAYDTFANADLTTGTLVSREHVEAGMELAVRHEASAFADLFTSLPIGQRRVLRALAAGAVADPYGKEFVSRTGYASASGVKKAIDALRAAGLVTLQTTDWGKDFAGAGSGYRVVSPFLRHWLLSQ